MKMLFVVIFVVVAVFASLYHAGTFVLWGIFRLKNVHNSIFNTSSSSSSSSSKHVHSAMILLSIHVHINHNNYIATFY